MTFEEFKHEINRIESIPDNATVKISRNMLVINWNITHDYPDGEKEERPRSKYINVNDYEL